MGLPRARIRVLASQRGDHVTIERLTPEQEAELPIFREEWLQHGLSTAPTDRVRAEEGMRLIYEATGLDQPKHVLWFTSPALGALAVGALKSINWVEGGQLWGQLGDQLGDQLGGQLRGQLEGQLWGQLWDQLGRALRTLRAALRRASARHPRHERHT